MGISLNTKAHELLEFSEMHVEDENGEKLYFNDDPVTITIYGKGSKQFKQALSELNRKSMQRKGKPQNLSVILEDNIDYLASLSKSSKNLDNTDGTPVSSTEDFKAIYSNDQLFYIKDQVNAFLDNNSNFTQK